MDQMSVLDRLAKGYRGYVLLFCLTFLTALPGIFTMPVLDRDEARFAQASKQMLETGDYITIRYQDGMRNKKPAGIHWLQAGSTALFSTPEAKAIWSYRLPSVLGAALTTMAVFWAGLPLLGRRAAFVGAALFGTGFLIIFETNMSKTDCVLVALTTLGVGALIYLRQLQYRPKAMAILFWFAMGSGFLIKGPVTPMVAFLALIFASLWNRRGLKWPGILSLGLILVFLDNYINFGAADAMVGIAMKTAGVLLLVASFIRFGLDERKEAWFRHLVWWPGPVLFVAIVLPWFLWIQAATNGAFYEGAVNKDLKDKVVGASEGHGGPPGYHLILLSFLMFPATLFLVPAIREGWRTLTAGAASDHGVRFLLSWIIPTALVFEFLPTKLPHYLLPAYPAIALLCGYAVTRLADGVRMPVSRTVSAVLFLVVIGAFAIFLSPIGVSQIKLEAMRDLKSIDPEIAHLIWKDIPVSILMLVPSTVLAVLAAATFLSGRNLIAVGLAILCGITLTLHTRIFFLPQQTWLQSTVSARAALAEVCGLPDQQNCASPTPDDIQALGYAEPSFVFTTGTDVKISPESSSDLPPATEVPVIAYVLNTENKAVNETTLQRIRDQAQEQGRCVGESSNHPAYNYADGNPVNFVAVVVDSGPCAS